MVDPSRNHQWWWWEFLKTIAIPSLEKNNHRHSIALKNWPSFRSRRRNIVQRKSYYKLFCSAPVGCWGWQYPPSHHKSQTWHNMGQNQREIPHFWAHMFIVQWWQTLKNNMSTKQTNIYSSYHISLWPPLPGATVCQLRVSPNHFYIFVIRLPKHFYWFQHS